MELLDRYVTEVGKYLPRKNRLDIEKELRSTLRDMLEDRSRETGRPVDASLITETLKVYGAPETVAATYQPENYLIGPKAFPVFVQILKMALVIYTIVKLVLLGISLGFGATDAVSLAATVGNALTGYFTGLVVVFGWVVLVFAFLERILPANSLSLEGERKAWDPADLLKQPDEHKISPWEQIFAILFLGAMLIMLNFFPHIVRMVINPTVENPAYLPILSEAFFYYLPWLSLLWVFEIGMDLVLLRFGRWTSTLRWVAVIVSLAGIGLLAVMLVGPALIAITAEALTAAGMPASAAATLATMAQQAVRMGLAFVIIGELFSIIKHLFRLFARSTSFRPPISE